MRTTTAIVSFVEDRGRVLTWLQTLETQCWGSGSGAPQRASQERVAPLSKAPEAVPGLLGVRAARVLQPFPEKIFIFP